MSLNIHMNVAFVACEVTEVFAVFLHIFFHWGMLVLLICVQLLVRLDGFSHSITMEV